jgi:hypothetical protein
LNDPRFAHAGCTIQYKTSHAISWRIVDKVQQPFQNTFGSWILYPAFLTEPLDAFIIAQECRLSTGWLQVREVVNFQSSSQISTGYGLISTEAALAASRSGTMSRSESAGVFSCRRRCLDEETRLVNYAALFENTGEDRLLGIGAPALLA